MSIKSLQARLDLLERPTDDDEPKVIRIVFGPDEQIGFEMHRQADGTYKTVYPADSVLLEP
jgi:hypothetical protein